jgi:hypothetical protein
MSPIIAPWRKHPDHNCPMHLRLTGPRQPTVDYHERPRKPKQAEPEGFNIRVKQVGMVLALRASGMTLVQISASLGYPAPWAGWVIEEAERRNILDSLTVP